MPLDLVSSTELNEKNDLVVLRSPELFVQICCTKLSALRDYLWPCNPAVTELLKVNSNDLLK